MDETSELNPDENTENSSVQPLTEQPGKSNTSPDNWQGNPDYFQTGKKAGQLKPRAKKAGGKSKEFSGLDVSALRATEDVTEETQQGTPLNPKEEKAKAKAERKSSDARVGAKIAMRVLDVIVKWISGGDYGKDFTPQQRKDRNEYAEELENDWREYLLTLDIPLHPGLIVAFGSITYIADALATEKGQEKVTSMKEKIFGKVGMMMFNKGAKK